MRLKDKIAVITGAASGIGLSTAELFAQNGARVILTDIDDARGTAAAKKIDGESRYRHLDVSKEQDWKLTYDWILDKYGYIDILVNNAGITGLLNNSQAHNPENFDTKEWQHVHNVNTLGTALGCKTAISLMLRSEAGSIVNISSRSGVVGIPLSLIHI